MTQGRRSYSRRSVGDHEARLRPRQPHAQGPHQGSSYAPYRAHKGLWAPYRAAPGQPEKWKNRRAHAGWPALRATARNKGAVAADIPDFSQSRNIPGNEAPVFRARHGDPFLPSQRGGNRLSTWACHSGCISCGGGAWASPARGCPVRRERESREPGWASISP